MMFLGFCLVYIVTAIYMRYGGGAVAAAGFAQKGPAEQKAAPGKVRELWWKTMRGFDYRKGTVSEELKTYDKQRVKVPGFMVPLDDDAEKAKEFLLVPYVGACIHTPPPPPNQIVLVKMAGGKTVPVDMYSPVWVEGLLQISKATSVYGEAAFTLTGYGTERYKEE